MNESHFREIPYNYTSADDQKIFTLILGTEAWLRLQTLRSQRVTGRSAKLLMRFVGDLFILYRNPFLFQDLLDSGKKQRDFLKGLSIDLGIIDSKSGGNRDVLAIIRACRGAYRAFEEKLAYVASMRDKLRRTLGAIVGRENIFFDPLSLISHATDATDWRLHLPLAVILPMEESQVSPLLVALKELKLGVIPRGAGTGLTGGAVPVREHTVMINLEKLNRIRSVERIPTCLENGVQQALPVIELEAGVITGDAMKAAKDMGLVFATDPTSSWACTIGGNIAENAGGKTAVLWGTAIDNIFSFRMVAPDGSSLEIRRISHPWRKILPADPVVFEVCDEAGEVLRTIRLRGDEIRKKGLWKDITNKHLGGLPGLQKEGTDGIITSARFILYQAYAQKKTCCLEFFGESFDEAGRVILEISREFVNRGEEALFALEHFDEAYVRAINYKIKAPKRETPKAVLLIDIVAHTPEQAERGVARLKALLGGFANTFLFIARDEEDAERYWQDRKRLGAIASRTNAFKLNEDIVLPLEALAEFTGYVEEVNVAEERVNQLAIVSRLQDYLQSAEPLETPDWLSVKHPRMETLCREIGERLVVATGPELRSRTMIDHLWAELLDLLRGYGRVSATVSAIIDEISRRLIVIATHMHAGDGNVHVNIPVFSNDLEMMRRAAETADQVMDKAVALGGVVSGEHGIGITKLKYLDRDRLDALNQYRQAIDPRGLMNPGKLSDLTVPDRVFTPSFNLLGLEARILQRGALKSLSDSIAKCMRCGRCKADCCVFYPAANMFYHPRNKNLAIASLIEALLYTAQRFHSTRFESLKHLEEIADHCTICHKCASPCPVDIDTGKVSILEREILAVQKYKHTALATRLSLSYLESRSPFYNSLFHGVVLRGGSLIQQAAVGLTRPFAGNRQRTGRSPLQMLRSPLTTVPADNLRDHLPHCREDQAVLISPLGDPVSTVFYFPGCGSERLFSDIAMAAVYILIKSGSQVVIPPPSICCGFPARANAKTMTHNRISLRNSIIFSQIRKMFGYLDFDACLVSCGTCMEGLLELGVDRIFGAAIEDISGFALRKGLRVSTPETCLYHAPCHDTFKGRALTELTRYAPFTLHPVAHCCSEAGTMALSRPDIANALRERKGDALRDMQEKMPDTRKILTNCPSCIQGLGRNRSKQMQPRHIAVDLAEKTGGPNWATELHVLLRNSESITF
ncbi:DUF3683 domain-containing protein [bacterium]|nr:DUF3683 domain-containing protein [bacterium]